MAEAPAPAPKPPQQPRSMASGSFDELIHPFMMDSVENFQFNEDGPPQMNVPGYGTRRLTRLRAALTSFIRLVSMRDGAGSSFFRF